MTTSVISFYSFKGGVGRTQAIANIAVALARRGIAVTAVDMDFESPGLHHYFTQPDGNTWSAASIDQDGVLDFLNAAIAMPDDAPQIADSFLPCRHPQLNDDSADIRLLLPGRLDRDYAKRVAQFSWAEFYQSLGYEIVEALREQLISSVSGDHVILIDSRTGMTDVAGICTFQLPDIVVAMTAPHHQGIDGIGRVAKAIIHAREAKQIPPDRVRELVLLLSRVEEDSEVELREYWIRRARQQLSELPATVLFAQNERVPYEARAAFGEPVVVGTATASYLATAYEKLTDRLLAMAGLPSPLPARGNVENSPIALLSEATQRLRRQVESTLAELRSSVDRELGILNADWPPFPPGVDNLNGIDKAALAPISPTARHDKAVIDTNSNDTVRAAVPYLQLGCDIDRIVERRWSAWRKAWTAHFTRQMRKEVADTTSAERTEALKSVAVLLKRGNLDGAKSELDAALTQLRQRSRRSLLARNKLEHGQLREFVPDREERIDWLRERLREVIEVDLPQSDESAEAIASLRNCLRLLVQDEGQDARCWDPYDILCRRRPTPNAANDGGSDFELIGLPLWRAAWHAYLDADEPLMPQDKFPSGQSMRAELERVFTQHEAGQQALTDMVRHNICDTWDRWSNKDPSPAHTTLAALMSDRGHALVLRQALGQLSSPEQSQARRALTAHYLRGEQRFDADVAQQWARSLIDDGYIREAVMGLVALAERSRAMGQDAPNWSATADLLIAVWDGNGEDVRNLLLESFSMLYRDNCGGRQALIALVSGALDDTLISREFQCQIASRLCHGDMALSDVHSQWLSWRVRHPEWSLARLRELERRLAQCHNAIDKFPIHGKWPVSPHYKEHFTNYWQTRVAEVQRSANYSGGLTFEKWLSDAQHHIKQTTDLHNLQPRGTIGERMKGAYQEVDSTLAALAEYIHDIHTIADKLAQWPHGLALYKQSSGEFDRGNGEYDLSYANALSAAVRQVFDVPPSTPNSAPDYQLHAPLIRWNRHHRTILDDLLSWSVGERTWEIVVDTCLTSGSISEALAALQYIPETDLRDRLHSRVEERWHKQLSAWSREVAEMKRQFAHCREQTAEFDDEADADSGLQEILAEGEAKLQTLADLIDAAPYPGQNKISEDNTETRLVAEIAEVREYLELANTELANRVERRRRERRQLAKQISELTFELYEKPALAERAEILDKAKIRALRMQNHVRLRQVLDTAQALQRGEDIDIVRFEQTELSETQTAATAKQVTPLSGKEAPPPAPTPAALASTFSQLAQRLLESNPAVNSPKTPYQPDIHFEPARVGGKHQLITSYSAAHAYLRDIDPEKRMKDQAVGVFLLQRAKVYLLEDNMLNASLLFSDTLKWLTNEPERESEPAWRNTATWGYMLAFAALYHSQKAVGNIAIPKNLERLFHRPIDNLLLDVLFVAGLLAEFAHQVLRLGTAAPTLVRYTLLEYLNEHPIAREEFSAGLFREPPSDPATLRELLDILLPVAMDDGDDIVKTMDAAIESSHDDAPESRKRRILGELRTALAHRENSLSIAILDAIEHAIAALRTPAHDDGHPFRVSLMTPLVALSDEHGGRIVLSLSGNPTMAPIFGLRVDTALMDASGKQLQAMESLMLDSLRADERREVAITIHSKEPYLYGDRRIRARYLTATADGSWRAVPTQYKSFAVHIEPAPTDPPPPTPYVVGVAVTQTEQIFGREQQIDTIYDSLRGREQDNAVLIMGERRIGKTTLLNALAKDPRIRDRYSTIVIIDQQDLDHRADVLFRRLYDSIISRLRSRDSDIISEKVASTSFSEDPGFVFRTFLQDIDQHLQHRGERMLLILDELEKVYSSIAARRAGRTGLPEEVLASLRAVIQSCHHVSFVLAGVTDVLKPQISSSEDRLFKLALTIEVDPLAAEPARQLIEQPSKDMYKTATQAAEYLAVETGGHPYLLQCVCHHLYRHMTRRRATVATMTDVEDVLNATILPDAAFFSYLTEPWRDSRNDYVLLRALSHLQSSRRYVFGDRYRPRARYLTVADIERQIARNGVLLSEDDIADRLSELCESMPSVVERRRKGVGLPDFRLRIGLLARHVRWLTGSIDDLALYS